jgi:3-deoxy-D-manno-octulosonic-acid transferase
MGGRNVQVFGNLKLASDPLPADVRALAAMRALVAGRPAWLAASTHEGEEEAVARAHASLSRKHPRLLTIVVPRHPARGHAVAATLRARALAVAMRSRQDTLSAATAVYVADTLGELGLWFRLCPIVFMGGSLVAVGGHNPLEPARLGCAVLAGPHVPNFRGLVDDLATARALRMVNDDASLAAAVDALLMDGAEVQRMGQAGRQFSESQGQVLPRLIEALAPWLDAAATETEARPRSKQ